MFRIKQKLGQKGFSHHLLVPVVVVVAVAAVGGYILTQSHASSLLYQYFDYSPGIRHNNGNAATRNFWYGNTFYQNKPVWQVSNGEVNGHYMWYGPYTSFNSDRNILHVCWDYIPPYKIAAKVTFDVTYDSGQRTLFSKTLSIPTDVNVHNPGNYWPLHTYCADIQTADLPYKGVEIRAKPINVGASGDTQPNDDSFYLYKTTWQLL